MSISQTAQDFISLAATIGVETKDMQTAFDAQSQKALAASNLARQVVTANQRTAAGFNAVRFVGLARVGDAFAKAPFNDHESQGAIDAITGAVKSFFTSFTGTTEKSDQGGRVAGALHFARLGSNAERLRRALQDRLDYHQTMHDAAGDLEDKEAAVKAREDAKRYLVPCKSAPKADGTLPEDKHGKTIVPAHNGRPECAIMVGSTRVEIPAGGATNRDSQLAFASRMFMQYGDAVLAPEVLDSLLDNGGKYQHDTDTVGRHASDALTAVEKLLNMGGATSADAAHLNLFSAMLERIGREGFKKSQSALPDEPVPVQAAPVEEQEAPAPSASESGDPIDDLLSQASGGAPGSSPAPTAPVAVRRRRGGAL